MSNLTEQTSTNNREFKGRDWVVLADAVSRESSLAQILKTDGRWSIIKWLDDNTESNVRLDFLRHATDEEIAAGRRIENRVTVITPSGTQKVKGGMVAFVEMGDDTHIENHISPLCKQNLFGDANDMVDSERLQQWKNNIQKFAGFRASNLSKNESQPVLIVERDNQIIERLKVENVVLQAKVDELHKQLINQGHRFNAQSQRIKDLEHKSGELKKQRDSFIKAYDIEIGTSLELQKRVDALKGLVIELKKLDMENGSIEITSEFVEEIICDFEQALKGDVEYIRAQCDMLGGGGEA